MEQFRGKIEVRLQNEGSKSEGYYAFLVDAEGGGDVKLSREGAYPAGDPFFAELDGREVVLTGEMSHGWLVVQSIDETTEKS